MKTNYHQFYTVLIAATVLVLAVSAIVRGDTIVYNLKSQFSTSQNPNGLWSYNLGSSPITRFQTADCLAGWSCAGDWNGSIVQMISPPGGGYQHDWIVGDITVHPLSWYYGGQSEFVNITWTSPFAGTISISGIAWDAAFYAGRDTSWELTAAGTLLASRSSVYGLYRTDLEASFVNNLLSGKSLTDIPVQAGDVVMFQVEATTSDGHWVGIDMDITLVPEPTTIVLLTFGGLALLGRKHRTVEQ